MATIEATAPRIYAVTTGNGPDGRAPVMWRKADAGEGRYMASFLPWYVHPERNDAVVPANVLEAPEPRLAHREFAATPEEAFASPEGVFFERWDPKVNSPPGDRRACTTMRPGARSTLASTARRRCGFRSLRVGPVPDRGRRARPARALQLDHRGVRRPRSSSSTPSWASSSRRAAPTATRPAATFRAQTGETEFEVFKLKGLAPLAVRSGIRDGCVRIMDAIADPDLPLLVSKSCVWTVEALGASRPTPSGPTSTTRSRLLPRAGCAALLHGQPGRGPAGVARHPLRRRDESALEIHVIPHPHVDELLQAAQLGQLGR